MKQFDTLLIADFSEVSARIKRAFQEPGFAPCKRLYVAMAPNIETSFN